MKYIRTENGVFKVSKELKNGTYLINGKYHIEKEKCQEADTIKELCDEFVYVNKIGKFDKSYVIYFDLPNRQITEPTLEEKLDYIYKHYKEDLEKIRGAIYTNKGLIYVAKMNEKGDLNYYEQN